MSYHNSCAKMFSMLRCFQSIYSIYFGGIPLKHIAYNKLNPHMLIPHIRRGFNNVLKLPALKNLILVILASLHTQRFQINTLASHLPVNVAHYKTKQKRLLRFINSNFSDIYCYGGVVFLYLMGVI